MSSLPYWNRSLYLEQDTTVQTNNKQW